MQLSKKKELAARVLGVGKERIFFNEANLSEIKEAITRQDIIELHKSGAILVKEKKGRKKIVRRKNRRRTGKIKKKKKDKKREYVLLTRKLRKYAKYLLKTRKITNEKYRKLRIMIKSRRFKSKRNLKESLKDI